MKPWKPLGCLAAAVAITMGMFSGIPLTQAAETTFDDGTLTYTVIGGKQVSITNCVNTAITISIMPEIDGYDIVSIGDTAFAGCENLLSVTIPNTITDIGEGAFQSCTSLKSVTLPNAITTIPAGLFVNCTSLETVTMGNQITKVGDMAFGYCTSLKEMTLPDSLTELGNQVFYSCSSLEAVTIPETLTALGAYTFWRCGALQEFTIPAAMTDIGYLSFAGCENLTELHIEEGNSTYSMQDGVLYSSNLDTLCLYPCTLTNTAYTIPESVVDIYDGAFFGNAALQSVTLPEQLRFIGAGAFEYCTSLQSVVIPETVQLVDTNAFSDCESLTAVTFAGNSEATTPDLQIGSYAFFCCERLMDVELPKRVSDIGDYAFGVTEAASADSEEAELKTVEGFLLTGHEGAASKYISRSRSDGLRISFKSEEIPWTRIVLTVVSGAVLLLLIVAAVQILRKRKRQAAEAAMEEAVVEESTANPTAEQPEADVPEMMPGNQYTGGSLQGSGFSHHYGHHSDNNSDE